MTEWKETVLFFIQKDRAALWIMKYVPIRHG